uniref:Cytochrome c oxidase subunit 2 n=1 Tax=Mytilus galloprovincialis TaxID=29158 RepID=Q5F0J6_MYTGA|nr:cytochrome c oxidase subunit II [Mytilus galloprovincialis]AAR31733.1 cytochrome c oxidase subunit II [Mytilus galloprovincialis]
MSFYGSRYFGDIVHGELGKDLFRYHGFVMMVAVAVLVFVMYMGCVILFTKFSYRHFLNRQRLEFWWTIVPMLMLVGLWFPSMINLYYMEEVKRPRWNFKAIGKQWYWSYEFCRNLDTPSSSESAESISCYTIDSYMEDQQETFSKGGYRLLDVDNRMVAPADVQMTAFVSSSDVLHSFALPKLLIKVDAIPGRINRLPMKASQCSIIYGQCSEICGVNPSFMPIVIEFIPEKYFVMWLEALN